MYLKQAAAQKNHLKETTSDIVSKFKTDLTSKE